MNEIVIWVVLGGFVGVLMAGISKGSRIAALEEVIVAALGGLGNGVHPGRIP